MMCTDFSCAVLLDLWGTCSASRPSVSGKLSIKIPDHRGGFVPQPLATVSGIKRIRRPKQDRSIAMWMRGERTLLFKIFLFLLRLLWEDRRGSRGIDFYRMKQTENSKDQRPMDWDLGRSSQLGLHVGLAWGALKTGIFIWLVRDAAWALGL